MRRLILFVLCASLLLGGCRGTRVNIMGIEVNKPVQASTSGGIELTPEEKAGVILLVGIVIAGVVVGIASN